MIPASTRIVLRAGRSVARELRERLAEPEVHPRTGCMLHSSYCPMKLLWPSCAHPDASAHTVRWVSPPVGASS
jgi:gluconokinase